MARLNRPVVAAPSFNHEGTRVANLTPFQELRRLALTSLLWEDTFYETGTSVANRAQELIRACRPEDVARLAVEGRQKMHLRHMPLFLVRELARVRGNGRLVASTLEQVIQRPDELTEYLAIYWKDQKDPKTPLSAGSKRGLAAALDKFNEYNLAKYDRDGEYKLRDVLRLVHPKPSTPDKAALWKKVLDRTLTTPDTWEVELSAGKNKKEVFERLLREDKLGGLAFLRNLRNMIEAGVNADLIRERCNGSFERVLPFRFITAATYAKHYEPYLEKAMLSCLQEQPRLKGLTALIIDTSPSMWNTKVSAKSDMDRFEAAAALAILIREICEEVAVWSFNSKAYAIPPRRGFALRDTLAATKGGYSCGGLAVTEANKINPTRIIVLTDGQWHYMPPANERPQWARLAGHTYYSEDFPQKVAPTPNTRHPYMINVASYSRGVGYGQWTSIDGWSERIIDYIMECENG